MHRTTCVALVVSLAIAAASCSNDRRSTAVLTNPLAPTAAAGPGMSLTVTGSGRTSSAGLSVIEWHCLSPSSGWTDASCAASSRIHAAVVSGAPVSTPAAPVGLSGSAAGNRVTLVWTGDGSSSYVVEAGSAPGLSNLANADVGTATGLIADNVPPATYYVRVRAKNAAGISGPSNEIVIVVAGGAGPCVGIPNAPSGLSASATGSSVALNWAPPSGGCAVTFYMIEAGSGPSLANLANVNTGSAATSFSANGVGAGTYYVRVRGGNANGLGAPSNEAVLIVGSSPGPSPTPTPTTGRLAFSTTASQGWTSITITVNGQTAGTLTRYFEPGNPASCDAVPGARIVVAVPAGLVSFSARTESGGSWSGTQSVAANGCSEILLTCPNRNCGGSSPAPTPPPPPTPTPTGSPRLFGGPSYSQFLGIVDCINCTSFNAQSVNNQFGSYGNPFSSTSIWNQFSQYGSAFSTYSACNQVATQPPIMVDAAGNLIGELTLNQFRVNAIKAPSTVAWLAGVVCRH